MRSLSLLLPAARPGVTEDLAARLRRALARALGVSVTTASLPADLFAQVLETPRDAVAWAPALVARDLDDAGLASPIAVVEAPSPLASTLVGRAHVESLTGIAGARVGWVSRLSATGYRVPRLYLASFGLDLARLFASERFFGSHEALERALLDGEIDVAATHSGRLREALASGRARSLASVGPIPADMILATPGLSAGARACIAGALLATPAGSLRFAAPRAGHLDLLDQLTPAASASRLAVCESGIVAVA